MTKFIIAAGLAFFLLSKIGAVAQPVPGITQNPLSQSVEEGSNASFSVSVTGQSPDYYWYLNGTNLVNGGRVSGASTPTLTIANVISADAGDYQVIVSNRHGTASSSVATLTVLLPPQIVTQPIDQSVLVKSNASFSVTASGTAPMSYFWKKDGVDLFDSDRINGASTATLTIIGIETTDAGGYSVTVSNLVGITFSEAVELTILVPPTISQQPADQSQLIGSNITFSVTASGDSPLSYRWFLNGSNLVDNLRISGALTSSLSISNLQSSDEGSYSVIVSNSVGSIQSEAALLQLLIPPSILQQPNSQVATNGRSFTLTVAASGTAPLSYQWYFSDSILTNNDRIFGTGTPTLSVFNVGTNDAGKYRVVASNSYGNTTSEVATITFVSPPVIVEQPTNRTILGGGGSTTFDVRAEGTELMSFQWYFNGQILTNNTRRFGCNSATMTITNLGTADSGNYYAIITNQFGAATSLVAVLTVYLPPSVSLHPISQSAPAGLPVTLNVTANGSSPLSYQWWFNGSPLSGATSSGVVLGGLTTNKVGDYWVVITNAAGSVTSAVAQVTFGSVAAWGRNLSRECLPPAGLSNVLTVAGSYGTSLGMKADGTIVGWGATKISGTGAVAIATSAGAVFLRPDGTVAGLEGLGVPPTSNVVAISIGQNHGLALRREGTVTAWGSQSQSVPSGLNNVAAVAAGTFHSLALKSNGTVVAWGINTGTNVPLGLKNVSAIAAGPTYSLALRSNGTVIAWGTGSAATVPRGLSNVIAIAAGNYSQSPSHNLALRSDGTVVAWGNISSFGETNVPPALSNVIAIASAAHHSLAIVGDGRPLFLCPPVGGRAFFEGEFAFHGETTGLKPISYQWRFNGTNIVGATNVSLFLTNVQFNAAGSYSLFVSNALGTLTSLPATLVVNHHPPHILALETNKTVYYGGKLTMDPTVIGSGKLTYKWRKDSTDITGATNRSFSIPHAHFTNAGTYTLVVSNYTGTVISTPVTVKVVGPVAAWSVSPTSGAPIIPANLTNAIAIAAAGSHGLALRDDGTVVGFGSNFYGQTNIPPTLSNVVEIAAGGNQSLALRTDGTVVGWGSVSPPSLATLSNIVSIAADSHSSLALRADGSIVRIAGSPVPSSVTNIIALAPFDDGFYALRADGTFYANGSGSLPPATNNVMAIASSRYHGTLLRRDGSVLGWGTPGISNAATDVISVASTMATKWAVDGAGTVIQLSADYNGAYSTAPTGLESVSVIDAGHNYVLALTTARDLNAITLSDATDTTNLVLSSKGSAQWFADTNVQHDGVDAARSAEIGSNTATSMRMFVSGPAAVRFWWKVSSQTNSDHLSFSAGGIMLASISGETGWQQRTINIPSGGNIIVWKYAKDGSGTAGRDSAWVDQIQILPPAPFFLSQPLSQNVLSGNTVQFLPVVSGAPPLFYRWYKNGNPLPSETNSSLTFSNVRRTHSGTYSLTVTNTTGSAVSSNAILKVITPQLFTAPSLSDGAFVLYSKDADGSFLSSSLLSSFQAQVSTNLLDWDVLPSSLSITNGMLRLQDAQSTNSPNRFYRILENW